MEKPQGFDSAEKTAEAFARDKEKTGHLLKEAREKARKHRRSIEKVWDDMQALFRLVRAWTKGEYSEIPWQTAVFAITAIVYFVNPFDVIPDFIPATGLMDDAAVIGFVVKSIKQDIDQFVEWEAALAPSLSQ